jgi:hypothetical protein
MLQFALARPAQSLDRAFGGLRFGVDLRTGQRVDRRPIDGSRSASGTYSPIFPELGPSHFSRISACVRQTLRLGQKR